jgi:3',5'-cyclic AMP phosphodiesterase CpdA
MRAALTPLYEKYHVDAVLQGHDHMYARTHKVAGGKVVDPSAPGVIYVISVSGPKMYEAQDMNTTLMAKVVQQKQFYQIVDVTPDRLSLTAYAIDGEIADRFELRKSGAGSLYVDGSSDTPQSK